MMPSASQGLSAERMWSLVPSWTRACDQNLPGSGLLLTLIKALGVAMDATRDDVLRLLDDMFVETCAPALVPLIGDLVGVEIDLATPISRQRDQVNEGLSLRRRRGTTAMIERLGWQITGASVRVLEAPSPQRSLADPLLAARLIGQPRATSVHRAMEVTGRVPRGRVVIEIDMAWPVRRKTVELVPVGHDVYAVDAERPVGLRRPDGTPIFLGDDPHELVGPGKPIEVNPVDPDQNLIGALVPRFMRLEPAARVDVPHRTLAIDPERGRVAGPSGAPPGGCRPRRFVLRYWEPLRGEIVTGVPAPQGDGVFTFSDDGRAIRLTDEQGVGLRLAYDDARTNPRPGPGERLLVACHRPAPRRFAEPEAPFVLLPPGRPLDLGKPTAAQGLPLDVPGLDRFFAIQDAWDWPLFRTVVLTSRFGVESPPDGTVEVDVERGRFRIGPAHRGDALTVRYHRPYAIDRAVTSAESAIRDALPLGCSATFRIRDTAPGAGRGV